MKESVESDEAAPDFLAEVKKVGGIVEFGHYEQDNDAENGQEPIEWIVLDVQDNRSLLISKYGLERMPFNETETRTTWKTCSLRQWLYNDFQKEAFTELEQGAILVSDLDNGIGQVNANQYVYGGSGTQDRVFLLSYDEAKAYFESDEARICEFTAYAGGGGVASFWWLRAPYYYESGAYVWKNGSLGQYNQVNRSCAVRPALWISHDKYTEALGEEAAAEHQQRLQIAAQKLREELTSADGATVTFGTYEQDNNLENGPEPIEWIILDVQDGKSLLLSKYGLENQQYYSNKSYVTWETSQIRHWLNNTFLNAAFSEEEINGISVSQLDNSIAFDNSKWTGGNNTSDRVFLLSYPEFDQYLLDTDKTCKPTAYAKAQRIFTDDSGNCWWWLRSPGYSNYDAMGINAGGSLGYWSVDSVTGAVRPAMWIDLNSNYFQAE